MNISDVKLTVEVPLGVQRVVQRPRREDLSSHGHFTVRVTFTWRRGGGEKDCDGRLRNWRKGGEKKNE